jgi:hypothetical protein
MCLPTLASGCLASSRQRESGEVRLGGDRRLGRLAFNAEWRTLTFSSSTSAGEQVSRQDADRLQLCTRPPLCFRRECSANPLSDQRGKPSKHGRLGQPRLLLLLLLHHQRPSYPRDRLGMPQCPLPQQLASSKSAQSEESQTRQQRRRRPRPRRLRLPHRLQRAVNC